MKSLADNFEMYSAVESLEAAAKRLKIAKKNIVKLNANENPYGCPKSLINALSKVKNYHHYPDPNQQDLRKAIAKYAKVNIEQVVAGCGADELIDLIFRLYVEPNDKIMLFEPSFTYYQHVAKLNRAKIVKVSRTKDFTIGNENINLQGVKLVVISSPNNPTGDLAPREVIEKILKAKIPLIIDEAYFEFNSKSYIELIKKHQNLFVLRTLSKIFGLAGMRVGYAVANKNSIDSLLKIKPPYSINNAASVMAIKAFASLALFKNQVKKIVKTRDWLFKELAKIDKIKVYPSSANYLLVDFKKINGVDVYKKLESKGFMTRIYANNEYLKNTIRVSIGTLPQMEKFLETLKKIIA